MIRRHRQELRFPIGHIRAEIDQLAAPFFLHGGEQIRRPLIVDIKKELPAVLPRNRKMILPRCEMDDHIL